MKRRWPLGVLVLLGLLLAVGAWLWPRETKRLPAPATSPSVAPLPLQPSGPLLARAEPAGPFQVACPMVTSGPTRPEHIAVFVFTDPDSTDTTHVAGTVDEAWLRFEAPTAEGAGLVTLRGHEQASVVWWLRDDGEVECHFPNIPQHVPRTHRTVAAPPDVGDDIVTLDLCTFREDGRTCSSFSALDGYPTVHVHAEAAVWPAQTCRRTGALRACRRLDDLDLTDPEGTLEIDWLPPIAGTGVTAREVDGTWVVDVVPGSPGDLAGVVPSTELLGLHRDDPDRLSSRPNHDVAIGAEGEVVELHLAADDGTEQVVAIELGLIGAE